MRWVWVVIPLLFFSIIGIQESFADYSDEVPKYKAPLRQIRDDGVQLQNVQCNGDRILFFKIKTSSPMCIYERSIDRFDNTQIGWYGKGSPYFIELSDREYLSEQNSNLERSGFVTYKKDSQNNILYNVTEHLTNQDNTFLIHNVLFGDESINSAYGSIQNYDIVDEKGNDPVDWTDPRTSSQHSTVILDYALVLRLNCGENISLSGFKLQEESSFKILDGIKSVNINYPERTIKSNSNTEIKDIFWSQGKTEFTFEDGLKKIDVSEYSCISPDNSTSFVYEIIFEVIN